jgi:hypothetical protein
LFIGTDGLPYVYQPETPTTNDFNFYQSATTGFDDFYPINSPFNYDGNLYDSNGIKIFKWNTTTKIFDLIFDYTTVYTSAQIFNSYDGFTGWQWIYQGKIISTFVNGSQRVLVVYDISSGTYA